MSAKPLEKKKNVDVSKEKQSKSNPKQDNKGKNKDKNKKQESGGRSQRGFVIGTILILLGILIILCALASLLSNSLPYITRDSLETPELEELPEYTNQDSITVAGSTDDDATVVLKVNDDITDETEEADGDGDFEFDYEFDNEGEYTFSAATTRRQILRFRSEFSDEVTIVYDNSAPRDEVDFDDLPEETDQSELDVAGSISEPGTVTIEVNGEEYTDETDSDGDFEIEGIKLQKGENEFTVTLQDRAGNEREVSDQPVVILNREGDINGPGASTGNDGAGSGTAGSNGGTLPEADGELEEALSMLFSMKVMPIIAILAVLTFAASSSGLWLYKEYGPRK